MQTDLAPNPPRPTHCPQCSAVVRGDVPWCLACYTPLVTAPDPEPDPEPDPAPHLEPPPEIEPRHSPDADRAADADPPPGPDVDALAEQLLAELAARGATPTWSRWLPSTGAGRASLIAALLAGCSAVLLSAMSLVGLVL